MLDNHPSLCIMMIVYRSKEVRAMKRIALIHTVKSVLDSFEPQLRAAVGNDVKIHNILDDFLASDPADTGVFSDVNHQRLVNDIRNAELTGADLIVVTCSTLTPAVTLIRPTAKVPLVAVDDEMCRLAVTYGNKVTVLATARSTVGPTVSKIKAEAQAAHVPIDIESHVCPEAIAALKQGDRATHDKLVLEMARSVGKPDLIVLAQASMAHLEQQVAQTCRCAVLSSPRLCIEQTARVLQEGNR